MPLRAGQYQQRHVLFDGASDNSSTYTSASIYCGDYAELSVHVGDLAASSRFTLDASNDDGFRASITTWSSITGITAAGLYDITTGFRWLRAVRSSANSQNVVILQGRSTG